MNRLSSITLHTSGDGRVSRRMSWGCLSPVCWTGLIALCLCMTAPATAKEPYVISYSPGAIIHARARARLEDVYRRAGLPVKFVAMPHKRSLHSADEGLVDGETARIFGTDKKYPNLRRVNVKLLDFFGAAYVREESPLRTFHDELLDTNRVAAILGVLWSENMLHGRKAEMVSDYRKLLGMLVEKRVDMVLGSVTSVEAVLNERPRAEHSIRRLEPLCFCQPLYHYVHKKNERIIPLLEKALRELWEEDHWNVGTGGCFPPSREN